MRAPSIRARRECTLQSSDHTVCLNNTFFFKVQGHLDCFPLRKSDDEIPSTKVSQIPSTGKNLELDLAIEIPECLNWKSSLEVSWSTTSQDDALLEGAGLEQH